MIQDDLDNIRNGYASDILAKRENVLKRCRRIRENVEDPVIGLAM